MRKLMCVVGLHSKFTQTDKWGVAKVCRYCSWVSQEGVDDRGNWM